MSLQTWWIFVCAVFLICGTPGPNMLHILTRSLRFGFRRTLAAMAGCMSAILIAVSASAAGLSAVLAASPLVFDVLKYAGVAYLIYLGIKAWRDTSPVLIAEPGADAAPPTTDTSAFALYRGGLLVGLSNPKLLVFAAAFFPQFIDKHAPQGPQFAILVATFVVLESFWYCTYALGGRKLARLLTRATWQRAFSRLTGVLFMGFGAALLGYRP